MSLYSIEVNEKALDELLEELKSDDDERWLKYLVERVGMFAELRCSAKFLDELTDVELARSVTRAMRARW